MIGSTFGDRRLAGFFVIFAATALAVLHSQPAAAQTKPSSCVAELQKNYGSTASLNAYCDSDTDCTFQAAPGNASALAVIGEIVQKAQSCFASAGLKVTKEDRIAEGMTSYYEGEGVAETCALLIAGGATGMAEGVRATCQRTK